MASIAGRINRERVVILGWSRAILLQLAHPLMAAAIADHSTFRQKPWAAVERLRQTVRAMLGITFGSPEDREQTIEAIRAIHRRVHGQLDREIGLYPAGAPYSAEDPALVCWVHATLADSVLLAYENLVGPLSMHERDAYCEETAAVALALGARTDEVPWTAAGLSAYLDAEMRSGRLAVGPTAGALATPILWPRLGVLGEPLTSINRFVTIGWLPPVIRAQYGYTWTRRDDTRLGAVTTTIRTMRRILPATLAHWRPSRRPARTAAGHFSPQSSPQTPLPETDRRPPMAVPEASFLQRAPRSPRVD